MEKVGHLVSGALAMAALLPSVTPTPTPALPKSKRRIVFDESTRMRLFNDKPSYAKYRRFMITAPWSEILQWNRAVVERANLKKSSRQVEQVARGV